MTTIKEYIAEFKSNNATYYSMGVVDDTSLYTWVYTAIKTFGNDIMDLQDAVIKVENGRGKLPDNYNDMRRAFWCRPKGYFTNGSQEVQEKVAWTRRDDTEFRWELCTECVEKKTDNLIVEEKIINDEKVDFYYEKALQLFNNERVKRSECNSRFRKMLNDNPRIQDISVRGTTMYTNFKEGYVYLEYFGLPEDDEGNICIPDFGTTALMEYVNNFVNFRFYEFLLKNITDEKVFTLFQYYSSTLNINKSAVFSELKFSALNPNSLRKLSMKNKLELRRFHL